MESSVNETAAKLVMWVGFVVILACGIWWYQDITSPIGEDPGLIIGYWTVVGSSNDAFGFYDDHTSKEFFMGNCIWNGTWEYSGNNMYSLGPENPDYLFKVMPDGTLKQLNCGWTMERKN